MSFMWKSLSSFDKMLMERNEINRGEIGKGQSIKTQNMNYYFEEQAKTKLTEII